MTILTRDQILGAQDAKREFVPVPEWGGEIYVNLMSGTERDSFEQSCIVDGKASLANSRARLAVRCITDEAGNRLFADSDADALGAKSGTALDRVGQVAQRLNKMGDKYLEDLKGN